MDLSDSQKVHVTEFAQNAQAILEAAPDLYLILNTHFQIIGVSDAYLKATMVKREDILGRNIFDVFPDNPDDASATGVANLRNSLMTVLQTKLPNAMAVQKYDIRVPTIDGGDFEERYWSPLNTPVLGPDGSVNYIIHRAEDVTEFIRMKKVQDTQNQLAEELRSRFGQMEVEVYRRAQEIQETNKQLQTANRELESFAYVTSHDLKAPLRGIDSLASWIESDNDSVLSPQCKEYLCLMRKRLSRMFTIINGILQYAKAGRTDHEVSTVHVGKLLEEVINGLNPPETFSIQYPDNMPVIQTAKILLDQVFSNLIGNAIKYHNRQDGRIEIGVHGKGDFYEFFVRDDGPGIEPQYHEKIFELFNTLHSHDKVDSSGVGLSIVKKIITSQGGQIRVESEVGKGSTFIFSWPIPASIRDGRFYIKIDR